MSEKKKPSWLDIYERLAMVGSAEIGYAMLTGMPPNPVGLVTAFGEVMAERRRNRGGEYLEPVVEYVGLEELLQIIANDPERENLLWDGLQASMAAADAKKRIYLARVVANAMTDDAKVDEAQFRVTAMRELEGPHIAALVRLIDADDEYLEDRGLRDEILQGALQKEKPADLAALVRTGVVLVGSQEVRPGLYSRPRAENYSISGVNQFGRDLIKELQEIETN